MSGRPPILPANITCNEMGPEAFLQDVGENGGGWLKEICRACSGYVPCREWALNDMPRAESLIVGGTTHKERQRHRAAVKRAAKAAAAAEKDVAA